MNTSELLHQAETFGVVVSLDGERLKITGKKEMREKLRPVLLASKLQIVAHLRKPERCRECPSCVTLTIGGELVAGCVHALSTGPWKEEWRPIPAGITRCPDKPKETQGCGTLYAVIGGSKGPRLIH